MKLNWPRTAPWLLIFSLSLSAAASPPPVIQQDPNAGPKWAYPTLGDLSRVGRPRSFSLQLQGGPEPRNVTVQLTETHTDSKQYSSEVTTPIAPNAAHTQDLFDPMARYSIDIQARQGQQVLQKATVNSNFVNQEDAWFVIFAPQGTEFNYLGAYKGLLNQAGTNANSETRVSRPPHELIVRSALPSYWPSYLGPNFIVIHDASSLKLSASVQQALVDWAAAGGTLLLVSHGEKDEYQGSKFQPLLPLDNLHSAVLNEKTLVTGTARAGTKVLENSSVGPVATLSKFGQGQVVFIGQNLASQKELGEDRSRAFWKNLSIECDKNAFSQSRFNFVDFELLTHPKELPLPSVSLIAWYLVGYALVLIPLNYMILRRRDKMIWIVATLPLTSVGITLFSYAVNYARVGSEGIIREVGFSYIRPGEHQVISDHVMMLFSPHNDRLKLVVDPHNYLRTGDEDRGGGYSQRQLHWYQENGEMGYRDYVVSTRSLHRLRVLGVNPMGGSMEAKFEGKTLVLNNQTGLRLTHACWIADGLAQPSFSLPDGKTSQDIHKQAGRPLESALKDILLGKDLDNEDRIKLQNRLEKEDFSGVIAWCEDESLSIAPKLGKNFRPVLNSFVLIPIEDPNKPTKKPPKTALPPGQLNSMPPGSYP